MSTPALIRRMLNDGTIDAHVALGTLFDTYGTGNTPLTTWAAAIDTAMVAVNTYGAAVTTLLNTQVIASGALAEGTNSATIKTTAICYYTIAGKFYAKAITDNVGLTAAAAQAATTVCCYLICIDSAGTISSVKGTSQTNASGIAPTVPAPTAATCPIGVLTVTVTNAATFTAGTTDLSASDVAGVFANFVGVAPGSVTLDAARATMNTAIHTTLNAALVAAIPPAL